VDCGVLGYYFGHDSALSEREGLKKELAVEKQMSGIDTQRFLARIKDIDASIAEKEELKKQKDELAKILDVAQKEKEYTEQQLTISSARVTELEVQVERLNSIIKKDYSAIGSVIVKKGRSTWVIPNEVAVSMSQTMNNSVYLTVTDALDGGWVDFGERVPLKYGDGNCSIIPTGFVSGGVEISFACTQPKD
jgi:hypothetical protein